MQQYPENETETVYVKKRIVSMIPGANGLRESWEVKYECLDIDGNVFFMRALLGGWFGLHKYMTGHFGIGLLYTLTFGVCGVSYLFDLLYIITGNYRDDRFVYEGRIGESVRRERIRKYARPVSDRLRAWIAFALAGVGTFFLIRYGYIGLLTYIFDGMVELVTRKGAAVL